METEATLQPTPTSFKEYWARLRTDIFLLAKLLQYKPTRDQRAILLAIQEAAINPQEVPEQILVKAGTSVGKSNLAAFAAVWLLIRTYMTKVIVTAPTERQVRTVLMSEIRQHIARGPEWFRDLFEVHLTKINLKESDDWQIIPITASEATSVQGQHHKGLWIIAEEVSGINDDILDAFMRTLAQKGNGFLGIGNPNTRQGLLFRAFTSQQDKWKHLFTMSKLRLSEERPDLAHPEGIKKLLEQNMDRGGVDSPQYRIGVLGEFPLTEGDTILDYALIIKATKTSKHEAIKNASNPWIRRISSDFARKGGDQNVAAARAGNAVVEFKKFYGEPLENVELGFYWQEKRGWKDHQTTYVPDAVGMGQATLVHYDRAGKTWIPYGNNYSSPEPSYENAESCAWFQFKRLLETEPVSLPNDPEMIEQLATRQFKYMPGSLKIKVESKDEYKKRTLQPSPDESDAIIQLFYNPDGDHSGEVFRPGATPTSFAEIQAEVLVPGSTERAYDEYESQQGNRHNFQPLEIFYS